MSTTKFKGRVDNLSLVTIKNLKTNVIVFSTLLHLIYLYILTTNQVFKNYLDDITSARKGFNRNMISHNIFFKLTNKYKSTLISLLHDFKCRIFNYG